MNRRVIGLMCLGVLLMIFGMAFGSNWMYVPGMVIAYVGIIGAIVAK